MIKPGKWFSVTLKPLEGLFGFCSDAQNRSEMPIVHIFKECLINQALTESALSFLEMTVINNSLMIFQSQPISITCFRKRRS